MTKKERPGWATTAWMWLTDEQYDLLQRWHVRDDNWVWWICDRVQWVGTKLLCLMLGHKPVPDQCPYPEHDYCVFCNKSMPFAAERP